MHWIADGTVQDAAEELLGGKATNLRALGAARLPVPAWFCVTARVFDDVVSRTGPAFAAALARASDEREQAALERASVELAGELARAGLSAPQSQAILAAFDRLVGPDGRVAVRSSAIGEDSAHSSFAGQMESFLFVDRGALLQQVIACLASAFSPRCLLYRRLRTGGTGLTRSAVIVQRMVASRSSGVLFSMSPLAGGDRETVVSAAYGLGEGVVQDRVEVDTYVLDRFRPVVLRRTVAHKAFRVVAADGATGGTRLAPVPEALAAAPVLEDQHLFQLQALGKEIEGLFGRPQDIEWALDRDGRFHITQSRPITAARGERTRVFDSSNIAENFRGVTTPLTYSYVRRYYENIFTLVARSFGTGEHQIARNREAFANLVSFLNGSIYYNLNNWYRIFYVIPGFDHFVRAFEEGVGLQGTPAELDEERRRLAASTSHLTRSLAWFRIVGNLVALPFMMRAFVRRFEAFRRTFAGHDLDRLSADALLERFEQIQADLASRWGTPLLNDYYAFNFFSLLNRLARDWGLDASGSPVSDLLRGNDELASVEPVLSILDLARRVKETPELASLVKRGGRGAWATIEVDPAFADFRDALLCHVREFGDRRFDELKLETPRLEDDPGALLALLGNYLHGDETSFTQQRYRARGTVRANARRKVARTLRWRALRRPLFAALVKCAQVTMKYREYGRLARSRRCGMERSILLAIGQRLVEEGVLACREDVHFLTVEEITSQVCGSAVTRSLAALVAIRRRELAEHRERPLASRVVTTGVVYQGLPSPAAAGPGAAALHGASLQGIGCSPGRARGRARVVADPANASLGPGDILIARTTDPAWAFLMVAADGLVVERGNMLSHAAIIGRELGIPTVIGVEGLTRRVADGQALEIDGAKGTVTLLEGSPDVNGEDEPRTAEARIAS
jgi:phosphohistidine swiveling domain-containing protein